MHRILSLCLALGSAQLLAADRPNIVFIFSDDHALNAISAYGGPLKDVAPTPNIDRLAKEGAIFQHSYCANSICGPSRACVLTGKHSHINGFVDNENCRFDGTQTTFPKLLRQSGYQTAIIGKWHLISEPTGFDHWEILPGQGNYYNPDFITMDGAHHRETGYVTDIITDKALAWLRTERDPNKPFVLMVQHKAPHRNWCPAPRHLGLFNEVTIPEPPTLFDDYATRSKTLAKQEMSVARYLRPASDLMLQPGSLLPGPYPNEPNGELARMTPQQREVFTGAFTQQNKALEDDIRAGKMDEASLVRWRYQRYLKDYLRCVRCVDESVGKILAELDHTGLAKNTVVIYSSDQGFYLGEHGWFDKRWMFEESLSMPFLIRWPGVISPGSKPKAMIQNIDYAPTFLDMAGLKAPAAMQGKSFVPVLTGKQDADFRNAIYYAYYGEHEHHVPAHDGVRTDRYKLIRFPDTNEWNLFDLETDPLELHSLHADPAHTAKLAEMQTLYQSTRAQYNAYLTTIPASRTKEPQWKQRHAEKSKLAAAGNHDLIFIGDSITNFWEDRGAEIWKQFYSGRNALNLGFASDCTGHVLWRLLQGEFHNQHPKAVVLMVGTNNTGPPAETAAGIRTIIELIRDRSPDTKILLHAIFPCGPDAKDPVRVRNDQVNALLAPLADGDHVRFIDINKVFLEPDGALSKSVMPDLLHPNAEGYHRWADALEPHLKSVGL